MALLADPQNVTTFHGDTSNNSFHADTTNNSTQDFGDSSRGQGSGSGSSGNTKRVAVTHIFVSQHALAALVLFGLLFILASLVARRGRRYFSDTANLRESSFGENLQESVEEEREGSEGSFDDDCSEDGNSDVGESSRNIDFELENELSTNGTVKEKDLYSIRKEEAKHVTFKN